MFRKIGSNLSTKINCYCHNVLRHNVRNKSSTPQHLICFKDWSIESIRDVLNSANNLKKQLKNNTHFKKLDILDKGKVMILEAMHEPDMNLAISKAASLLSADDIIISSSLNWDGDYRGKILSNMADVIFLTTNTFMCVRRFAKMSSVPVLCVRSRAHCCIQAMSTIMSIMEQFGKMDGLNVAYIGPAHPILNSYLLLCPMLGANINYKCCCKECPVTPLLHKSSEEVCELKHTEMHQCMELEKVLEQASVVIAGPTTKRKDKVDIFKFNVQDIQKSAKKDWVFYHTCPRGEEVDDELFWHANSRTFSAYQNMQYLAAALIAYTVKDHRFK